MAKEIRQCYADTCVELGAIYLFIYLFVLYVT